MLEIDEMSIELSLISSNKWLIFISISVITRQQSNFKLADSVK